jgi:hypothetical protein
MQRFSLSRRALLMADKVSEEGSGNADPDERE